MDLFDGRQPAKEPLAARMRPRTLDEYIGQEHIVGKGRLLRRAIAADQLTSVIFYGPPGTGKTTLARVIANHTKSNFITLNAVLTGVQNIRESIVQAEQSYKLYGRRTILFVDEVHRWNKSQQDALLPWVENGTIILVGATTENPFFEVNKALVSRSRVFQLKPLESDDLKKAALAALMDKERGYGRWQIQFEEGALEHLVDTANGDARSLLNALELAVETTPEKWEPNGNPPCPAEGSQIYISRETAEESIQKKVVLYDRDGDYHYDIISAFIKSLRGRDPDAAMYWLAKMVAAGEDPGFIFRRMLISACEDTGLADPYALAVVESCAAAFDRVGLPEGRYHLAHAALYLATAPKSNSSMAFFDALSAVQKENTEVPNHLKDASRDAEGFGHGAGYMYPHAYRDHWIAQQYLPDALTGRVFYTPSDQGYENTIRQDVLSRRELQITAILEEQSQKEYAGIKMHTNNNEHNDDMVNPISEWWQTEGLRCGTQKQDEHLTFSPENPQKAQSLGKAESSWRRRLDSNHTQILQEQRDTMLALSNPVRHTRNFIWNADDGLLVWECLRRCPEGLTAGMCRSAQNRDVLNQYGRTLGDLDKPMLAIQTEANLTPGCFYVPETDFLDIQFDRLYFRDIFSTQESIAAFAESLQKVLDLKQLSKGWKCVIAQRLPGQGQRLSDLLLNQWFHGQAGDNTDVIKRMKDAEESFFCDNSNPRFAWTQETVAQLLGEQGNVSWNIQTTTEKRRVTPQEIERWLDIEHSAYGSHLAKEFSLEETRRIQSLLIEASEKKIFNWRTQMSFFLVTDK